MSKKIEVKLTSGEIEEFVNSHAREIGGTLHLFRDEDRYVGGPYMLYAPGMWVSAMIVEDWEEAE